MSSLVHTVEIRFPDDVVLARHRARQVATLLGFERQDQTRIATAVSEIVRNAFQYAGGGKLELLVTTEAPAIYTLRVTDRGPGIRDIPAILEGRYVSQTGMGRGIAGARRLMDVFQISSSEAGTVVTLGKHLPKYVAAPSPEQLARIRAELARPEHGDPLQEIQLQNQELLRALEEVRAQRAELEEVNRELEETNRGVVALYAEIDEKAVSLQRANEIKTRFLSNMTHEFRTPLNSIISLTRILLQRIDGDLAPEQEKQIRFVQKSAEDLSELVNDLLDVAKVEAGKIVLRPTEFEVSNLFGTLRGMLRPLLSLNSAVSLVFEEPDPIPPLHTDESKVSQILRNFISNALKYTERGEVRVSARRAPGNTIVFSVQDTGIGIAQKDQERIFDDFVQVDSPLQRRVRGTGLGLPLARRLASLLGGSIGVRSTPGQGSTFFTVLPMEYRGPQEVSFVPEVSRKVDPKRKPVLVVEDNPESLFIYEKYLKGTEFQVLPARTLKEAREWVRTLRPVAIVLDVLLEGESTWSFLPELREDERTRDIPVLVVTMVENERRAMSLGANAFRMKPIERDWLVETLENLTAKQQAARALIIDDDEVSRYILRGMLAETRFRVVEASGGREGLTRAREERPAVIFLDLVMPEMDGFRTLDELERDPQTKDIPVIIHTTKLLTEWERERLSSAAAILSKDSPTRELAMKRLRSVLAAAGVRDSNPVSSVETEAPRE